MAEGYKKFFETEIWKTAYVLQKEIFGISQLFPAFEQYTLSSQINRSTNSVCANLAESHGRFHYADKIRVLYVVRGEIEETQSHLIVAKSRLYLDDKKCLDLLNKYEILKRDLNKYINTLSKEKNK